MSWDTYENIMLRIVMAFVVILSCLVTVFLVLAIILFSSKIANAETKVWGFRGAGFEAWSQGVDQIAEQARHIHGVTDVRVFNYYETQQVYNEIAATPHGSRIAVYGYSCGANAATLVGTAFAGRRNINEILGMQPSIWCGGSPNLSQNIGYAQNTFAPCWATLGLGCQQWSGARRLSQIERIARHLYADEDPEYQNDVLSSIAYLSGYVHQCDPARHHCHAHTLIVHRAPGGGITHTLVHH
jgi:hypothetical protein